MPNTGFSHTTFSVAPRELLLTVIAGVQIIVLGGTAPKPKIEFFVQYLKIISSAKGYMIILTQIVWEPQKWHLNFSR